MEMARTKRPLPPKMGNEDASSWRNRRMVGRRRRDRMQGRKRQERSSECMDGSDGKASGSDAVRREASNCVSTDRWMRRWCSEEYDAQVEDTNTPAWLHFRRQSSKGTFVCDVLVHEGRSKQGSARLVYVAIVKHGRGTDHAATIHRWNDRQTRRTRKERTCMKEAREGLLRTLLEASNKTE